VHAYQKSNSHCKLVHRDFGWPNGWFIRLKELSCSVWVLVRVIVSCFGARHVIIFTQVCNWALVSYIRAV